MLTWPQGNGWLSQQLVAGLGCTDLQTDCSVLSIAESADGVEIDVYHHGRQQHERWLAARCIVALPSFIAARVVRDAPDFLRAVAGRLDWAPWLVANIHLQRPLADRPGADPAWDNVLFADPNAGGLGYVDAGHQGLDRLTPRPTVLSYYQALGDWPDGRAQLLGQPFGFWRDRIVGSLLVPHPDLLHKATRMEITRYGHAMAIPRPGDQQLLSQVALQSLHRGAARCAPASAWPCCPRRARAACGSHIPTGPATRYWRRPSRVATMRACGLARGPDTGRGAGVARFRRQIVQTGPGICTMRYSDWLPRAASTPSWASVRGSSSSVMAARASAERMRGRPRLHG